jgi:hypothetical protein
MCGYFPLAVKGEGTHGGVTVFDRTVSGGFPPHPAATRIITCCPVLLLTKRGLSPASGVVLFSEGNRRAFTEMLKLLVDYSELNNPASLPAGGTGRQGGVSTISEIAEVYDSSEER